MKAIFLLKCFLLLATVADAQAYDTAWVVAVENRMMPAYEARDLQSGSVICLEALDTARTRYGKESREAAELLLALSDFQKYSGDFKTSEQTILEFLAIWEKLTSEPNERVATGLCQLGYLRFRLGQFDTVEDLLSRSRQMFLDIGMRYSDPYCNVVSTFATYYQAVGFHLKAEKLHLEAVQTAEALPQRDDNSIGVYANNLGKFYANIQRHEMALRYYGLSLAMLEKSVGESHPLYLTALINKGLTLRNAGQYGEAESILKSALESARKIFPPGDTRLSDPLRALALYYQHIGQFEQALQLQEECLLLIKNRYGQSHPTYCLALKELSMSYAQGNRLSVADTLLKETLRILTDENRTQTITYMDALASLGRLYQIRKQYDLAHPVLTQSAALGRKLIGMDNPQYYLYCGRLMARQYLAENAPEATLQLLDSMRASVLTAYGERHQHYVEMEGQYGRAWQLKQDPGRALQHFKAAFNAMQYNLAENFSYMTIAEREKFLDQFDINRMALLSTARAFPGDENIRAFLYDLLLFQKALLISYDRQQLATWQQEADSTYRAYTEVRRMIALQWTLPVEKRLDLPELETQRVALEKTLSVKSALAADPDVFQAVHWQEVQKALQPGDAALEWLDLPPSVEGGETSRYAALLLLPGSAAPELVLLGETDRTNALFASKGSRGLQYATRIYSGDALYRALWQPLEVRLTGVKRIFYAPTGPLHLLNFDAIQTPDGSLLSEKYLLARVTNTSRILDAGFGKPVPTAGAALLAGGLDYEAAAKAADTGDEGVVSRGMPWRGGSVVREWAALPNTLPEVERLAALLQQKNIKTTVFTGQDGSETAVKSHCAVSTPDILHFATHGFFFEQNAVAAGSLGLVTAENPMFRSGLILAGANPAWRGEQVANTADDGILTADEISLLPLRNAALVVLSACETGLGDVHDDEGVYGLQRAFRLAGAQNIVMSLWRVPDAPTRAFMDEFYSALVEKGDTRRAFSQARNAMRKEYGNPYYWAGFVLLE